MTRGGQHSEGPRVTSITIEGPGGAGRVRIEVDGDPSYVLVEKEAADFLKVSYRTLRNHRTHGGGPPFRILGRRVIYLLPDLVDYLHRLPLCRSTADPAYIKLGG